MAPSPALATLSAPSGWRRIEILSDLHLQDERSATWAAWEARLLHTEADAIVLLGDLFEVWVGDDAARAPGFEATAADVLKRAAARRAVAFMPGNRDFLLGLSGLLDDCGVLRLDDPCVLQAFGRRWLLSHGDAACLGDVEYQAFRAQVRTPAWQAAFLAAPLAQRRLFARQARDTSMARHQDAAPGAWTDLDAGTVSAMLEKAQAPVLIHGHTHRPAVHSLDGGRERWVLSDWDLDATPPRADVLVLTADGLHREPLQAMPPVISTAKTPSRP